MYSKVPADDIDLFVRPARILISGYSGSGKSTLVVSILKKYRDKFNKVILLGGELEGVEKLNVIKDDNYDPFQELSGVGNAGSTLMIFDDAIFNRKLLTLAGEVFIRGRHLKISALFCSQNLFFSDKNFRQVTLNTSHIILLRHRDEKQIVCFARTFLSDEKVKKFLNLYKKVVGKKRHQHLLVDFTTDLDCPLMFRSNIAGEGYERVFTID